MDHRVSLNEKRASKEKEIIEMAELMDTEDILGDFLSRNRCA